MVQMQGAGSFGSRRRYLAEQEVIVAELFAKAAGGFTTPITKPVASFSAPSASAGPKMAKPKAAPKAGGGLPTSTERLKTLKAGLGSKVGSVGESTGAPAAAVGSVGKRADALRRLGKFQRTRSSGIVAPVKRSVSPDDVLEARDSHIRLIGKALKVKIIPETKTLPSLPGRPRSVAEAMRYRSAKPRTVALPKKRPSDSEVRAAVRQADFKTSAGKRRVTSAKEINDATTDAMMYRGGGLSGVGMSYGRSYSQRISKREPLKTSISEDDARKLVDRHGLKGPLPKTLDRQQKMAAYEARYVSAGGKKAEKWQHRAEVADKVKTGGLAVATAGGAGYLATKTKLGGKLAGRAPKLKATADTVAVTGAVAGGAGELYAGHARRKRSSYASAPAGVAASALRRMQDYTKD